MSKNTGQRAFHHARSKKEQKAELVQLYQRALALQNTGQLPEAQAVCRQLLKLSPRHFDALCLLAMFEYQAGNYGEAEAHLSHAVELEPRSLKAHLNRAVVLQAQQRFEEAEAGYRRAIVLDPGSAVARNNLGNTCWRLNRLGEAIENYDKAIALKQDFPNAWYNRGMVLGQLGRHEEALGNHQRALALDPGFADAWNGQGSALRALGRLTEALDSFDRALVINLNFVAALNNRGNALRALERPLEALDGYDKALAIDPNYVEALNGRGSILSGLRDFDQAIASFKRALAVRPGYAEAFANLGTARSDLGEMDQALSDFDRALALAPELIEAWVGRGHALHRLKRISQALACGERVLSLEPKSYRAFALIGHCLANLGRIDEAIARFDDALAIKPDFAEAISLKIFVLDFAAGAGFVEQRDARKVWWEQVGSKIAARPHEPHHNVRDPQRRLVVGYVSADFREHSAARAFKPVLQYADKALFETVCYSCSPIKDGMTEEFRRMADRWRDASQWSDDRLVDRIRQDEVDILIDLSGHTDGHRLGVFARKPAPIQVHGWGHGTPPGLPTIDYVFSDPVTIPSQVRGLFHEAIYDLPCIMTLDPLPADVPLADLPALGNGFITFGVFNRISKISDPAVEVWAQILDRLPRSKLLVKDQAIDDSLVRDNLLARFARYGLRSERIDLLGATSRSDHLTALNRVDICLDPFPQNGGVSTWEALQMGVPVVARLGNTLSSRVAGAILSAIGMKDWVAENASDYLEIAVAQGSKVEDLSRLRRALPGRIAASTAGNPAAYADEVAKAFRGMWQNYCASATDSREGDT
jgi:predicted O-linked N-acetylglucosamine transferase (SPINDLY family)